MERDSGVNLMIGKAGGVSALAKFVGVRQPTVSTWKRIPTKYVEKLAGHFQVDPALIRPDLYGKPKDKSGKG